MQKSSFLIQNSWFQMQHFSFEIQIHDFKNQKSHHAGHPPKHTARAHEGVETRPYLDVCIKFIVLNTKFINFDANSSTFMQIATTWHDISSVPIFTQSVCFIHIIIIISQQELVIFAMQQVFSFRRILHIKFHHLDGRGEPAAVRALVGAVLQLLFYYKIISF